MSDTEKIPKKKIKTYKKHLSRTQLKILAIFKCHNRLMAGEIVRKTGLSKTSVSKILDRFQNLNLILPEGKGNSTVQGGKKPTIFVLNPSYGYSIVISIKRLERTIIAMVNFQGKVIYFNELSLAEDSAYEEVVRVLAREVQDILEKKQISPEQICGIAIGCDGIIDSKEGIILNPTNRNWKESLPIKHDLVQALDFQTKILIDSTYRLSGYAELLNEKNLKGNILVLTWDDTTVFGGCMLSEKLFIDGHTDIVGEFPHIIIDATSPIVCTCGRRGCIGSILSKEAVFEYISRAWRNFPHSPITEKYLTDTLKALDIFREGNNGDAFAQDLLDHIIDYYAVLIHNVLSLHSAQKVILQGMFVESGDYFISNLKQKFHEFNQFNIHKEVDIFYSSNLEDASDHYLNNKFIYGAALYVSDQYVKNLPQ